MYMVCIYIKYVLLLYRYSRFSVLVRSFPGRYSFTCRLYMQLPSFPLRFRFLFFTFKSFCHIYYFWTCFTNLLLYSCLSTILTWLLWLYGDLWWLLRQAFLSVLLDQLFEEGHAVSLRDLFFHINFEIFYAKIKRKPKIATRIRIGITLSVKLHLREIRFYIKTSHFGM